MNSYTIYFLALLIGVVAGLRTMTAPAAVSWAAHLGALKVGGTWLAFMGYSATPWILTLAAIAELISDQLPTTPSRKTPVPFAARVLSGGLCGSAVAIAAESWAIGAAFGVIGAIVGTLGGFGFRFRLAQAFRRDRSAAFLEDAVAIVGAALIVGAFA
jgi:uncharacterized membrane protein